MTNRRFVLDQMRGTIRTLNSDIVFLQEVQGHHNKNARITPNWPAQPQFEYLADEIWPHFAYGQNAVYSDGHHGNAILSRHPFAEYENIDVSTNRFESRGILHGIIPLPDTEVKLHTFCLHFDLLERGRLQQTERLCERIQEKVPGHEPTIICGDFNDWGEKLTDVLRKRLSVTEVFQELN